MREYLKKGLNEGVLWVVFICFGLLSQFVNAATLRNFTPCIPEMGSAFYNLQLENAMKNLKQHWRLYWAGRGDLVHEFYEKKQYLEIIWYINDHVSQTKKDESSLEIRRLSFIARRKIENYLKCGAVVERGPLGGGATISELITLENGLKMVYKPDQRNLSSSPGSEVGAYLVDKLVDFNIVPTTMPRIIGAYRHPGSVQYFISESLGGKNMPFEQRVNKNGSLYMFDYLIKNIDRHKDNFLYHPKLDKLVAIDNSWSLRGDSLFVAMKAYWPHWGPVKGVDKRKEFEKKLFFPKWGIPPSYLYHNLKSLKDSELVAALKKVISPNGLRKLLKRKKIVLKSIEKAYEMYGTPSLLTNIPNRG